jgi:hypothetical protein
MVNVRPASDYRASILAGQEDACEFSASGVIQNFEILKPRASLLPNCLPRENSEFHPAQNLKALADFLDALG